MTKKKFKTKALEVLKQEKTNIEKYIKGLGRLNWDTFHHLSVERFKQNAWLCEGITYSLNNINHPDEIVYSTIINCIEKPGVKPMNPEALLELREYCYQQINEKYEERNEKECNGKVIPITTK